MSWCKMGPYSVLLGYLLLEPPFTLKTVLVSMEVLSHPGSFFFFFESPWLLTTNSTEQLSIFIVLELIYLFLHHTVDHLVYCDLQIFFDLCWLSLLVLLVSSQSFLRLCLPFKWWHCPDFCYWFLLFALHTFSLDKLIHRNRCS